MIVVPSREERNERVARIIEQDQGFIHDLLGLYDPLTEAHPYQFLGGAIGLLSAAIGWKGWIQWGASKEPLTVSVLLEGMSATGHKTTVGASITSLAKKASGFKVSKMGHVSGPGLIKLVAPSSDEEALSWELGAPPAQLIFWDEFKGVLGDPRDNLNNDYLAHLRLVLMQIINGYQPGSQTLKGMLPESRCAVSIVGTVTRQALEERVSHGVLQDGFFGRFLLIPAPPSAKSHALPPAWTPERVAVEDELAHWLAQLAAVEEEIGDVFKALTVSAQMERQYWYDTTKEAVAGHEILEPVFGRAQSVAIKAAAVLAVSEWTPDRLLSNLRIEERHVLAGQWIAEESLFEALELSGMMVMPIDVFLERAHRFCVERGAVHPEGKPVTRTELLDGVRMKYLSRAACWKAIESMNSDLFWVEKQETQTKPRNVIWALETPFTVFPENNGYLRTP